jgi:hypothetical protein
MNTERSNSMQSALQKKTEPKSNPSDRVDLRAQIEMRAHHLWRAEGGRHGSALSHWLQAEREIENYTQKNKL